VRPAFFRCFAPLIIHAYSLLSAVDCLTLTITTLEIVHSYYPSRSRRKSCASPKIQVSDQICEEGDIVAHTYLPQHNELLSPKDHHLAMQSRPLEHDSSVQRHKIAIPRLDCEPFLPPESNKRKLKDRTYVVRVKAAFFDANKLCYSSRSRACKACRKRSSYHRILAVTPKLI
jgi:hypothetical protein